MPRLTPSRTRLVFTRKAVKELAHAAETYTQRPQQQWRMDSRPFAALTNNLPLMRELYRMGNNDPAVVRELLIYGKNYIQRVAILRQQQPTQLPPTHPFVMSNINHPLNPSNPRNLMLNPGLNLLVQQDIDTQAAILTTEIEEQAENDLAQDTLAQQMVNDENLQDLSKEILNNDPEFNPYETLGLSPKVSSEITETVCLRRLAENAPPENEEATHAYQKIAAAAVVLGFGHEDLKHTDELALDVHQEMAHDFSKLAAPAA